MLSGVCIYAVINHLSIALRQPDSSEHLSFAGLCLLVNLAIFGRILSYQAQTIPDFVASLRWNLAFVCLGMILFPWVIAGLCRIYYRPYLFAMATIFIGLFIWNLFAPYTLQFSEIRHLSILHLPWGETLTRPEGKTSPVFAIFAIAIIAHFIYALYLLLVTWYRRRNSASFALLLAIAFFLLTVIEGIASRMQLVHFIQLGWLGFLAMIMTMSFVLNDDTRRRLLDSERRFRSLLEQSPFSMQLFTPDGFSRQVNPAWHKLWGQRPELQAADYNILQDPMLNKMGVMPLIQQGFTGTATEIPPSQYPLNYKQAGNTHAERWLRAYIYPILDETRHIRDVILMHEDVTNRKHVDDAIRLIAEGVSSAVDEQFFEQLVINLARVFEADYACMGIRSREDNQQIQLIAEFDTGMLTRDIDMSIVGETIMNSLKQGTRICSRASECDLPADISAQLKDVHTLVGAPLPANDHPPGMLLIMRSKPLTRTDKASEIIEIFAARASSELQRRESEQRVRRLAYQDTLTGLPNRAHLHEHLVQLLDTPQNKVQRGALLLIDLDYFKTINDALGHEVGDNLLRAVARRIQENCDRQSFLARLGGDEFVTLVHKQDDETTSEFEEYITLLAQRLLTQLAYPVYTGDRAFTLGASIGIVRFPENGTNESDLLRHADMALYQAKNKGRGIFQLYLPELEEYAKRRLQLEAGLRTAIEKNELDIHYQPQIDLHGNVSGVEALLRWHSQELGTISPDEFIPVAEETGLIHSIGIWIIEQVCTQLTLWERNDIPFNGYISINVCPWQFARPDFVNDVSQLIRRHEIDPHRIMLELTETALLNDINETILKLKELRQLGLHISLDDFGTGYSSLAYIRDLPLDQLKIDKFFVNELSSRKEHTLIESMIAIGKKMKLTVVAEGVENSEQRDKLVELGCEYFQGYFFCEPLRERQLLAWLEKSQYRN